MNLLIGGKFWIVAETTSLLQFQWKFQESVDVQYNFQIVCLLRGETENRVVFSSLSSACERKKT